MHAELAVLTYVLSERSLVNSLLRCAEFAVACMNRYDKRKGMHLITWVMSTTTTHIRFDIHSKVYKYYTLSLITYLHPQ